MATILGAVDGSSIGDDALRWAVALLGLDHEWQVLTVVSPHGPAADPMARLDPPVISDRQLAEALAAAEQHALDLAVSLGLTGDVRIETGAPGPTICTVATALPADLIVIGSHGRGPLGRALLGSVSSHVVAHGPCAVLVDRTP